MKQAVQIKCPHCQNLLRVPPDLVEVSVKCKYCGFVLQLKKKAPPPPPPPPRTTANPSANTPTNAWSTTALDDLPEFTPSAPTSTPKTSANGHNGQLPAPVFAPFPSGDEPAAAPSDYNPAFEGAGRRHTGRGAYKGPRDNPYTKWIAVGIVVLVGGGISIAVLVNGNKPGEQKEQKEQTEKKADHQVSGNGSGSGTPSGGTGSPSGTRPQPVNQMGAFPRRMLAIDIKDYMYMNPTNYGRSDVDKDADRKDFYKMVERLRTTWKIPLDESFYVTDGPVADNRVDYKHPPLKMVVAGTIDKFLATSRAQDRIVIIFGGHAIEKEGKAFLAPIEAELDEMESLIPLEDIYAKLAKCPAQEKLIMFDVCRFDPGHGVERPAFGEMTEALEKALHASPEGVSVWTSCSPGQYAYEYDYAAVDLRGLRQFEMAGSIFMNMFHAYDLRGRKDKPNAGLAQPSDPLPISATSEYVNEFTYEVVKDLEKKDQKPKLTLKTRKEWIAYNSKEPSAAKFEYPNPPPSAKRQEVAAIFKELDLPSIKSIRKDDGKTSRLADNFPFREEHLFDYQNSGPTFEEIQKSPEKYADFPLRVATVTALLEMRRLKQENIKEELPEEVTSPITDAFKKKITDVYQRIITTRQSILEDQKEMLESAGKKRDMEKSKRWLANYDYAYAQVRLRLAYIYEYNLAMGKVKLEQLPELDMKRQPERLAAGLDRKNVEPQGHSRHGRGRQKTP